MSGTGLDLNRLKQYRDEILKAEIGALLFNLGKTHIGFWKEQKEDKEKIVYFNIDAQSFQQNYGFEVFGSYKNYYDNQQSIGKSPFEYELEKYNLRNFVNLKVNLPFTVNGNNNIDWTDFLRETLLTMISLKIYSFEVVKILIQGLIKVLQKLKLSRHFGFQMLLVVSRNILKRRILTKEGSASSKIYMTF